MSECDIKISNGTICRRPIKRNGKCICHLENKNEEEIKEFNAIFDSLLHDAIDVNGKDADFTRFVFPYIKNLGYSSFNKCMNFERAIFEGEVNFVGITSDNKVVGRTFKGDLNFSSVIFNGKVNFSNNIFNGKVNFSEAMFKNSADFSNIIFNCKVNFLTSSFDKESNFSYIIFNSDVNFIQIIFFDEANFTGSKFNYVYFSKIDFNSGADFSSCKFNSESIFMVISCNNKYLILFQGGKFSRPKDVSFQNMSLENISFLYTDVTDIDFTSVKWIKHENRFVVIDEIILENKNGNDINTDILRKSYEDVYRYVERDDIAQLYRRLRRNLENNYRFTEAGDFFIGEMEMCRLGVILRFNIKKIEKVESWLNSNFSLLSLYKYLSIYGESYLRPSIFGIGLIFSYPILVHLYFYYRFDESLINNMDNFLFYLKNNYIYDFRDSVASFFQIGTRYLGERLIGIPILGLLFIALKRNFERKK